MADLNKEERESITNNFEKLLEQDGYDRLKNEETVHNGALVEGTVIKVTSEDVFLDIGLKTEGVISLNEFEGASPPKEGDVIKTVVAKRTPESVVLSFSKARGIATWEELSSAYENKLQVSAKITEVVKGGFVALIDKTVRAFIPISQIDVEHVEEGSAEKYIGKTFDFIIVQLTRNKRMSNVILSRKRLLLDTENKKKNEFFETTKEGDVVTGVVKNHTSFGVFVDLGGFDGLLHVSDLSWSKNVRPSEVAKKGTELKLAVTKLDRENKKINLSLKAMLKDPWEEIREHYNENDTVKGSIVKILPYGAFVHIEDGIEGFVHVSDISWTKRIHHPKDVLKVNSPVECKILSIDAEQRRISLGIKQIEENPWDTIDTHYPVGLKVKAKVEKILRVGAIVLVDDSIKGFISRDDYTWSRKSNINLKEEQEIECKVLKHDREMQEIKLGIKQLEGNPWETDELKAGNVVEGTISNITDFGVFIKVNNEIEGLVPKFQAYDPNDFSSYDEAKVAFKKGDKIQAVVQSIHPESHKLSLSIREIKEVANKKEIAKHIIEEDDTHNINLGAIIANNTTETES